MRCSTIHCFSSVHISDTYLFDLLLVNDGTCGNDGDGGGGGEDMDFSGGDIIFGSGGSCGSAATYGKRVEGMIGAVLSFMAGRAIGGGLFPVPACPFSCKPTETFASP